MRRAVMRAALTAALLVGGAGGLPESSENTRLDHLQTVAAGDASRGTEWRWEQCRFARYDGHRGQTPDEIRLTLRCASRRWDGSLDLAFRIVGCESGFDAKAQNGSSSAGGVWQALDSTWDSWKARYALFRERWSLSALKLNGRVNALLGFRILSEDGTGAWEPSRHCWG